jgi:hypothetical protein
VTARRLIRLVLGALVIGYLGYVAFEAFSIYLALAGAIDEAGQFTSRQLGSSEAAPRRPVAVPLARGALLEYAWRRGVRLDERNVFVSQEGSALTITVRRPYPVVSLADEPVVILPITVSRSFPFAAPAETRR